MSRHAIAPINARLPASLSWAHRRATSPSPWVASEVAHFAPKRRASATKLEVAEAVFSGVTCLFVAALMCSQLFGVLASSIQTTIALSIGQDPSLGPYDTGKDNDVPYTDRVLVCIGRKKHYNPVLLGDLLPPIGSPDMSVVVDTTGNAVAAYRVIQRSGAALDSGATEVYMQTCSLAAETFSSIVSVCEELGYNVTTDNLRVVVGVDGTETRLIHKSLPLLIMPYWDNSHSARAVIPGWDGSACMIHLVDKFERLDGEVAVVRGINRTLRETKTEEWLDRPVGIWRNGWYEDQDGVKWYSDMMTTSTTPRLLPGKDRYFDVESPIHTEIDCTRTDICRDSLIHQNWGPKFSVDLEIQESTSVVVFNGTQYGIFWFDGRFLQIVRSVYDWPMLVSNATVALLIFRWAVALAAIYQGYRRGHARLHYAGIGVLSNSMSFQILPLLFLPHLSNTLSAFFSVGCYFQGQQNALAGTWFVVYPAIIETVLVYYSLLNTAAKILRRRITDILFVPTIVGISAIHFFRNPLMTWEWLGINDGLAPTLVTSDEMDQLSLDQFFTTDIALRLNGNIHKLFIIKLVVLAASLVPLLFTRSLPRHRGISNSLKGVEKALAVSSSNVAGLGRSTNVYELLNNPDAITSIGPGAGTSSVLQFDPVRALSSYEVIRLGCVIYGDKYLITMDDWDRVSMLAGFRHLYHLWNHRVVAFRLRESKEMQGEVQVAENPRLMRVDDPELIKISFWNISGRQLLC